MIIVSQIQISVKWFFFVWFETDITQAVSAYIIQTYVLQN